MEKIQLFVNVQDDGNIVDAYMGENIIATESYHFFFLIDEKTALDIEQYKVAIIGMTPQLILKEVSAK